jgi:hypothetical protein
MEALSEVLPYFDHYMNGGSSWPEGSWETYSLQEVSFDENGAAPSLSYKSTDPGTGIYFFHNGMDSNQLKSLMSVLYSTNTKYLYVYLPCDLTKKSVTEWISFYEEVYPQNSYYAVGLEGAGEAVLTNQSLFSTMVFIDTKLGNSIEVRADKKYFFACTDESDCYSDMGALYRSCKRNGATFEYRVINTTGDSDILRCANKLKSYIPY